MKQHFTTLGLGALLLGSSLFLAVKHGGQGSRLPCQADADCPQGSGKAVCLLGPAGKRCYGSLAAPPTRTVTQTMALGRSEAAAAVAWLVVLDFIGSPWSAQVDFRGLGPWIELVVDLDPDMDLAYLYGAILLATQPDSAEDAERLLIRAEKRFASDETIMPQIYQWRAFVAHYGLFDSKKAAAYYAKAYELKEVQVWKDLADKLSKQASTCDEIYRDLQVAVRSMGADVSGELLRERRHQVSIMQNCFAQQLDELLVARRVYGKPEPKTFDELVKSGELAVVPPTLDPELVWVVKVGKAALVNRTELANQEGRP